MTSIWRSVSVQKAPEVMQANTMSFSKLECQDANGKMKGSIKCQGWLQGCGLMGLSEFHIGTHRLDVGDVDSLLEFLPDLDVFLRHPGTSYKARRYMFTLAGKPSVGLMTPFAIALAAKAEKLTTFKNLAHGPADISMYLLTV